MGLTELLISMLAGAILMAGTYRFMIKTARVTSFSSSQARVSRSTAALRETLARDLRNIGYNPKLVEFSTNLSDPDRDKKRMGVILIKPNEVRFNSDDNLLFDPLNPYSSSSTGEIQESEKYGYWVEDASGNHISFDALTLQSAAEPCTNGNDGLTPPTPFRFSSTYKLMGLVKPSLVSSATIPTVLSSDIVCFEVRYYSDGDPMLLEPRWVRVGWDASIPSQYHPPPGPGDAGYSVGTTSEKNYFQFLRDHVRKIEIGIVVAGKNDLSGLINPVTGDTRTTEKIILESRVMNTPWLRAATTGNLPGG